MDFTRLFETAMKALQMASPAFAAAPAFKSIFDGVVDLFDGDQRQDELKAAYAAKRAESDAAEQDFKDAAAGR
jgi:hypothetical protein